MKDNIKIYILAICIAVGINIFSWHLPFFWDTILTSTITQNFYHEGFQNFITPAQFDAGHPPLFYIYITAFYFLFGKTLMSAHLAMLLFILLGIFSFIKILQHFQFSKQMQYLGLLLYFSIPAVLTQYCLVSYDAVLLSLYLLAIFAILKNKKILLALVLIGIVGISLRGLFCWVSLAVTIYFLEKRNVKSWLNWLVYFTPSVIIFIFWITYHYTQTGWLLSTNAATWSEHRSFTGVFGLFKNGVSITRCFFDFGIIILSLLSIFYLIQKRKIDNYTLLWLIPAIVFTFSFLPFTNPINHRYFLIVYVLMLLPVLQFLSDKKNIYSILTCCVLWIGHFLIYPVPISNGWDCTMVHTNYNNDIKVVHKSIIDNLQLDRKKIGTVFPMNASLKHTNMFDDTTQMINIHGKSIDSIEFVLFSNIGNDFSDEQIKKLRNWFPVIVDKRNQIKIILYRNPKFIFKINPK